MLVSGTIMSIFKLSTYQIKNKDTLSLSCVHPSQRIVSRYQYSSYFGMLLEIVHAQYMGKSEIEIRKKIVY